MDEIDVTDLTLASKFFLNEAVSTSSNQIRKTPLITQEMFERGASAMLADRNASAVEQLRAALLAMGFKETWY